MNEQVYTNFRLVLPDEEMLGTLVVRNGLIADIQPGITQIGIDGDGDYLLPGLVELHTDNLERCASPRPGVSWPLDSAVIRHDKELIGAGITTACAAISIRELPRQSFSPADIGPLIGALESGSKAGRLAADHRLNLRCELSCSAIAATLETHLDNPQLALISLMDHTPGQRQYSDPKKLYRYLQGKYSLSAAEADAFIHAEKTRREVYAARNQADAVRLAQSRAIPLASHDDATLEHVAEAARDGVAVAEFPTTLEAAKAAHEAGIRVLMGAPNVILNGSHSGNSSALDVAARGWLDILSSDYIPHSLLPALFTLSQQAGMPLYKAVRLATIHPAAAIFSEPDRGKLQAGMRADMIRVRAADSVPCVAAVWVQGNRVG